MKSIAEAIRSHKGSRRVPIAVILLVIGVMGLAAYRSYQRGSVDLVHCTLTGEGPTNIPSEPLDTTQLVGRLALTASKQAHCCADAERDLYLYDLSTGELKNLTLNIPSIWNANWSPDGTRVAFLMKENADAQEVLWVMNADGGNLTELPMPDENNIIRTTWAPDSQQLALEMSDEANPSLTIYTISMQNPAHLNRIGEGISRGTASIMWSPDSSLIATYEFSGSEFTSVRVRSADGSGEVNLLLTSVVDAAWAIDGQQVAIQCMEQKFGGAWAICLQDLEGSASRRLTPYEWPSGIQKMIWSPTGRHLAVTAYEYPRPGQLYIVEADDGSRIHIDCAAGFAPPTWSPDGTALLVSRDDLHSYVVDLATYSLTNLTSGDFISSRPEVWSPDSKYIGFAGGYLDEHEQGIYVIEPDGSHRTQVIDAKELEFVIYTFQWLP